MPISLPKAANRRLFLITAAAVTAVLVVVTRTSEDTAVVDRNRRIESASGMEVDAVQNAAFEGLPARENTAKGAPRVEAVAPGSLTPGEQTATAEDFASSVKKYTALAAELDMELAAYRRSMPAFAGFLDVCIDKIVPLAIEGEKAGLWLSEMKESGPQRGFPGSKYDRQVAERAMAGILGTICRGVYDEFQEALDAGRLQYPDEQERIYYLACYHHFRQVSAPLAEPLERHCPYAKGTVESYLFIRDLGQTAVMASSPLKKMACQIPPELAEKQRGLDDLYERLVQLKKQSGTAMALPERYQERYLKRLEDEFRRVDQTLYAHLEIKQLMRRSLDQAMDDEVESISGGDTETTY
jgi:hypothetical protein